MELNLDTTESIHKDILVIDHFKNSNMSLLNRPPKLIHINTSTVKDIINRQSELYQSRQFFSELETIVLELDDRDDYVELDKDDLEVLLENATNLKRLEIGFYSEVCSSRNISNSNNSISNNSISVNNNLQYLCHMDKLSLTTVSFQNLQSDSDGHALKFLNCHSQTLEHLYIQSVELVCYPSLVNTLSTLTKLVSIFLILDDPHVFKNMSVETLFKALLNLTNLESLYLSFSVVFDWEETTSKFQLKWFQHYLNQEQNLKSLGIDFASDQPWKLHDETFTDYLFQEKKTLQHIKLRSYFLSEIKNPNLKSLSLEFDQCITAKEQDHLVHCIVNSPYSNLEKLVLINDCRLTSINSIVTRILSHSTPITYLKTNILKKDLHLVIEALLSPQCTLKKLYLTPSNSLELDQEAINQIFQHPFIDHHPTLSTIIIETNHPIVKPFYCKSFKMHHNHDKMRFSFIKS
eukprot:gene1375-1738_t